MMTKSKALIPFSMPPCATARWVAYAPPAISCLSSLQTSTINSCRGSPGIPRSPVQAQPCAPFHGCGQLPCGCQGYGQLEGSGRGCALFAHQANPRGRGPPGFHRYDEGRWPSGLRRMRYASKLAAEYWRNHHSNPPGSDAE